MNRHFSPILFTAVAFAGLMIQPAKAQMNIVTGPIHNGLTVTCAHGSQVMGVLGVYTQTCHVSGGSGTYSWAVSGLPKSFSTTQDNATLTISGIPYQMATHTIMVTALDSNTPPLTGNNLMTVVVQAGLGSTATPW